MYDCDFAKACVVESYFDLARIEAWLRTAWPLDLTGQVSALKASCALESSTKNRLEDVCAWLFHNLDMLQDPSIWPVKHAVQQLASQEAGTVFGEKYADRDKAAGESCFITLINKREKHVSRHTSGPVRSSCSLLLTRRIEAGTCRGESLQREERWWCAMHTPVFFRRPSAAIGEKRTYQQL